MHLSPKSQKYKENKAKMMKFWMVTPVVYVSKIQRAQGWFWYGIAKNPNPGRYLILVIANAGSDTLTLFR